MASRYMRLSHESFAVVQALLKAGEGKDEDSTWVDGILLVDTFDNSRVCWRDRAEYERMKKLGEAS